MSDPSVGAREAMPVGVTGRQLARWTARNALGLFAAIKPTAEREAALGEAITAFTVRWINDEFDLGFPSDAASVVSLEQHEALREAVGEIANAMSGPLGRLRVDAEHDAQTSAHDVDLIYQAHKRLRAIQYGEARAALSASGEPEWHRCVKCGARDRGERDWGLDHAQTCGGDVPRPPGWASALSDTQEGEE